MPASTVTDRRFAPMPARRLRPPLAACCASSLASRAFWRTLAVSQRSCGTIRRSGRGTRTIWSAGRRRETLGLLVLLSAEAGKQPRLTHLVLYPSRFPTRLEVRRRGIERVRTLENLGSRD